jgi:hypothetical protein
MVATKMLISLCLLGLARAAPQLGVPTGFASQSANLNEQTIVTSVVSSLQPSIAEAVANALRGLNFGATTSNSASNTFISGSTGSSSSSDTGFAYGNRQSAQFEEEVTARPNYAYEFKVADDDEQTYITHNEARDGDDVTGTYSYVDPTGALITVNYQAGAMGYTQTVDKQEGAVSIRSKTGSSSVGATSVASSAFTGSRNTINNNSQSTISTSQSSSAINESDLIARIITALQPQISSAVNTAVSSQRSNNVVSRTVTSNTGFGASGSVAGDRLTPLFGN